MYNAHAPHLCLAVQASTIATKRVGVSPLQPSLQPNPCSTRPRRAPVRPLAPFPRIRILPGMGRVVEIWYWGCGASEYSRRASGRRLDLCGSARSGSGWGHLGFIERTAGPALACLERLGRYVGCCDSCEASNHVISPRIRTFQTKKILGPGGGMHERHPKRNVGGRPSEGTRNASAWGFCALCLPVLLQLGCWASL